MKLAFSFGSVTLLISVLLTVAPAWGQVPDPIFNDANDPGYAGPNPTTRDTVATPTLASTNESAETLQYTDRELGPVNVGFDLKGGFGDNLFNLPGSNQSGPFAGFGVPFGLRLRNVKTQFNLNYRLDKVFYPTHTEVDNLSQTYSHQLEHHTSEHTALYWNLIAARLTSVGQYLPSIIPIGSGGVAQGPVAANALASSFTTSNAATSVGFSHDLSENDKVLGTLTGGWVEQAQGAAEPGMQRQILRNQVAGLDLQYERATSLQGTIGAELTNIYIRGQVPRGHENHVALLGTYKRKLAEHVDFRVGAGPLYSSTSGGIIGHETAFSYAATADLEYRIQHTCIAFDYARVFQLGYQQTASIANEFSAFFDRELVRSVDLTVDARYVRTDSRALVANQSTFGVEGRVNKSIAPNVLLFLSASRTQQQAPGILVNSNSYNRDDVFGGITVLLGNPLYRRGAH